MIEDIITVMDYPDEHRYNVMCKLWVYFIEKNIPNKNIVIYTHIGLSNSVTNYIKKFKNIEVIRYFPCNISHAKDVAFANNKFLNNDNFKILETKMYIIANRKKPFLHIDVDAFVIDNVDYLFTIDKEISMTNHQNMSIDSVCNYFNSGVMVVNDNILDYTKIIDIQIENKFQFEIGGIEQPCVYSYLKHLNYDYTDPGFTFKYNSNSIYNTVARENNKWVAFCIETGEQMAVHHYYNTKPWNYKCPLFDYYSKHILS